MTSTNRHRHPIIASVLAASLVTGLVVPPAVAEPFGPRIKREDGRRPDNKAGRGPERGTALRPNVIVDAARDHRDNRGPRLAREDGRRPDNKAGRGPERGTAARPNVVVVDSGNRRDRGNDWGRRQYRRPIVNGKAIYVAPKQVRRSHNVVVVDSRDRRDDWGRRHYRRPIVKGPVIYVPHKRIRRYRNVIVVRPYGRWYRGYGFHHHDADAWHYLAFTAITLAIINNLNERQQRTYENAQIQAATAPVGRTIVWNDGGASGTVTALRDGTSSTGQYCREFRQTVTIAGRAEEAYGTACRKPDGAWEVISSGQ